MKSKLISDGYDIAVIGAGPAGCMFSERVSKDFNVVLLDKLNFPREKPCGGMLVEESQEIVKKLNPPDMVFSSPKFIDVRYMDIDNNIDIKESRGLWNISRKNFDYWLLEMAKEKVTFSPETSLLDIKEEADHIKLFLERNGQRSIVKCKYLVCADGAFSLLRRKLFNIDIKYYTAIQKWISMETDIEDVCYFMYNNEITDFYSWLLPKKDYILLGTALEPGNIQGKMEMLEKMVKDTLGLSGNEIRLESTLILRPSSSNNIFLGKNNIFFIGESAGLISSSTGEGISFALRSGEACAKAFNIYYENAIEKYKKLCQPLVEEAIKKIDKGKIFSSPQQRKLFFDRKMS